MATLIFDGHNDALGRMWRAGGDAVAAFGDRRGHVNVPDAATGGFNGGFFAMFSPAGRQPADFSTFDPKQFGDGLPPPLDEAAALAAVIGQAGIAHRLQAAGMIEIVTGAQQLKRAFTAEPIACILHLEGADCIGADLLALDALHALGLRSLGIVWSRATIFGEGVPLSRGSDGDTGPGLTEDGLRLVRRCKALGITIDTSHLTMKGFWDVGKEGVPLVATHSNSTRHCLAARNLTDDQLRAIGETGGVAGLNFGTIFLDPGAWEGKGADLDACLVHLDHMIETAGEDHVALGSDFDGAPMPRGMGSAADLPMLVAAMETHGYGAGLIAKICHENWLSFLARQFGASQ